MEKHGFTAELLFITLSGLGGFLLSLTGISIGWMIGTLVMAIFLSFWQPRSLKSLQVQKGIQPYWRYIGQCILGIQIGQQISASVLDMFEDNWVMITIMLLLTIIFGLLSGVLLWRFSKSDLLTSLFSTTPGGISAMPAIAEEVGANPAVVSIVQTIRIVLVVVSIPLLAASWNSGHAATSSTWKATTVSIGASPIGFTSFLGTFVLILTALGGYYGAKRIKLPAPWLIGSMTGAAFTQILGASSGFHLNEWWPHWFIILAQIFIGSSIGSRVNQKMFVGAQQIVMVSLFSSICLVVAMVFCAFGVSKASGITLATSVLAFAPGGVAEMATSSIALHADAAFVVAVQSLRLIAIFIILPPLFRFLRGSSVQEI